MSSPLHSDTNAPGSTLPIEQMASADQENFSAQPIALRTMGSLMFAGGVIKNKLGDTYHGDHGYAQYFVPQNARDIALILWHGVGQSGRCWESTPDGREGFWQILTRRDWPLYIIDQPRRGRAGRFIFDPAEHAEGAHPTLESEATAWSVFRLGPWEPPNAADFFPGLQFPTDEASIRQFLRQQTPNTGPEPFPDAEHREFMGDAVAQLVDITGPSVLVCHSHSAQYGWVTAMNQPDKVKAIVAIEPGEFAFPEDDPPPGIPTHDELLASFMAPQLVSAERFDILARQPILVIMGDNIAVEPHPNYGVELWRIVRERARQFVATINRRGGDATYLELPDAGLKGNTHFAMADLNNVQVAEIVTDFLASKGLAGRGAPHRGPRR